MLVENSRFEKLEEKFLFKRQKKRSNAVVFYLDNYCLFLRSTRLLGRYCLMARRGERQISIIELSHCLYCTPRKPKSGMHIAQLRRATETTNFFRGSPVEAVT